MLLWQQGVRIAARRMPKVINPPFHAVLDYAFAGSLLLMAARHWNQNRRAAVGSLICGAATFVNAAITDYPGGIVRRIDYRTHARNDAVIAGLTASAPRLLGFSDDDDAAGEFGLAALAQTAISGLTDYDGLEEKSLAA
jgi:hypothetical protein